MGCFLAHSSLAQYIPEGYHGEYKGDLQIFSGENINKVDMEFRLKPTDEPEVLDYVLIYHSPQRKDVREYILKPKDTLGNYELDEQNGIIIPTRFVNDGLHSFFEVQNNLLKSTIKFHEDHVEFEILMANKTQTDTSATSDKKFTVFSYPVGSYQFARLERQ
jgi:hypothetical protein